MSFLKLGSVRYYFTLFTLKHLVSNKAVIKSTNLNGLLKNLTIPDS